ncbi:MAG: ImmA/IrrE family metallo-endopeptidase [Candidatus Dadabacteria bacterium]|nr:ImmA/IrrE family metallo-endopeptidase [Candidatus Dadabacteria bacterium]
MRPSRRCTIVSHAQELLQSNKVTEPPVPVVRIIKKLGVRLLFSPLDSELSGIIYINTDRPIIGVNALHHPNRRRFTIAHECGHLILHKAQITKEVHIDKAFPMLMRNSVSAAGVDKMEIEANLFAAELLMPELFLTKALGSESFDIDDESAVSTLANSFKVSSSAMRFRLGNLFV